MTDPRPVVYIASPYTKGDVAINVRASMRMFDQLLGTGLILPVCPLWTHFQHLAHPRPYEWWVQYDLALIPRYDACLRIPARFDPLLYLQVESSGADNEVAEFKRLGKPVFNHIWEVTAWAEKLLGVKNWRDRDGNNAAAGDSDAEEDGGEGGVVPSRPDSVLSYGLSVNVPT